MAIRFTRAARKHLVGRAHVLHVMTTAVGRPTVTAKGQSGLVFVGPDDRNVELEVVAANLDNGDLLVIHAMPTHYRR